MGAVVIAFHVGGLDDFDLVVVVDEPCGAADVAGAFDASGLGAIVNSSRGIIFAHDRDPYREQFGDARWQEAVEAATHEMISQLRDLTPAGQLSE